MTRGFRLAATLLLIAMIVGMICTAYAAENPTVFGLIESTRGVTPLPRLIITEEPPDDSSQNQAADVWWTEEDVKLLAALISAESRGEPYEGQVAVGCVVLNRLDYGYWGDTISEVIYSPYQFASPYWSYGDSEYQAALECLESERVFPAGVLYFQVARRDVWFGAQWYTTIGNHNFYIVEGV